MSRPRLGLVSNGQPATPPKVAECLACEGTGWVERENEALSRCECLKRDIAARKTKRVMRAIPPIFRFASLDRPPLTNMPAPVRSALGSYRRDIKAHAALIESGAHVMSPVPPQLTGLWLSGPVGTGKSTALAALAIEASTAGLSVGWWPLVELLERIKLTFADDSDEQSEHLMEELDELDVLVLDDVATPNKTEWAHDAIYRIVNRRYNSGRTIWVNSDVSARRLDAILGARVSSRLYQMTGGPIEVKDQVDHRRPDLPEATPDEVRSISERRANRIVSALLQAVGE